MTRIISTVSSAGSPTV